jgi:hypothetical protein
VRVSQLLTGQDVWPALRDLTNSTTRNGRAWCAIAYIGVRADSWLHLRAKDTLVCDASDSAVRLGLTSPLQLRRWVEAGVAVYSHPGMHAKVGALSRWAFVGSANASDSSATMREEAVLLTADARTRAQVRDYVKGLLDRCRVVNGIELDRLDHIKVRSLPWPKMEPRFRHVITDGARLHLWEWDEINYSAEEDERAKRGLESLTKPDRRGDRLEVTLFSGRAKDVLPAAGDYVCWVSDRGQTLAPAKMELVMPRRAGARAAVFYLVRADLRSLRTDDVEKAIAVVDPKWKASKRLSPRATRAVAALDWARPKRASSGRPSGR